jgi:pyruvate-formate lyase
MAIPTVPIPSSSAPAAASSPATEGRAATESLPLRTDPEGLRQALAFTETYRRTEALPPAQREAAALAAEFPAMLLPIRDGDLLAGRIQHPPAGFSPEPGGFGYYCDEAALCLALARAGGERRLREKVEAALAFWRERTTTRRVRAAYPEALARLLPSDDWCGEPGIAFPLYRLAGVCLDFGKLVAGGLSGLRAEVAAAAARGAEASWVEGMGASLDVVAACCRFYAEQARDQARGAAPPRERERREMAEALDRVAEEPPRTLPEALQLGWLYSLVAGTLNYGRMDVAFGSFLARDREAGRLTEDEALLLLESLWRLMAARRTVYNGRVVVGGVGRPDPEVADAFARLALEATRRVVAVEPQLSLRFQRGTDPTLVAAALDAIGAGRTFPILYNDDVNVPAVEKAFGVPRAEAEQYVPFGCGEYVLEHRSLGTPSGVVNVLKALEAALHGGRDPRTGRPLGRPGPGLEACPTFDALFDAYRAQVEPHVAALAEQEALEYRVLGEEAPFLLLGLLHDDCLARGRPLLAGGARYLGGTLETYGNVSTADSLAAIRRVVYEERRLTPARLLEALRADFAGFEPERRLLKRAAKYGNDDPDADAMAVRVHEHVCAVTSAQAPRFGLDTELVVIINNHANSVLGRHTGASADGRRVGEPLSNGNNPSSGNDRAGTTAFLRSLTKLDPSLHAGAVQNMKVSRELFGELRPRLETLLRTYFDLGGAQAMITVVGREELEAAMREPEKWGHLMVRVGGFSARFVELGPTVQREILERTLH